MALHDKNYTYEQYEMNTHYINSAHSILQITETEVE